jgi:hypothetical protein
MGIGHVSARIADAVADRDSSMDAHGAAGTVTLGRTEDRFDYCASTAALTAGLPAEGWAAVEELGDGLAIDAGARDLCG